MNEPHIGYRVAQAWWIASELVRRHPHLFIIETHPLDGFYDCLDIVDLNGNKHQPKVSINRLGSVHVLDDDRFEPISLVDAMSFDDAHVVVKRVETATGWGQSSVSPKTTARSLAYRVISRVLASLINDRQRWDVRCAWEGDSLFHDSPTSHYLSKNPLAEFLLHTIPSLGVPGEPLNHLWALQRNDEVVALIDTGGRVVTDSGLRELLPSYRAYNRSLTRVIGEALGDVLP
jgi:hypothetical protein